MMVKPALVTRVLPGSIAEELGFEAGDRLVSINGQTPRDLIDYRFFCADECLELEVLDAQGAIHQVELEKDYDADLGLEFETALFDGLIQCNNRCPFCFIDQQPPGKRETLYLKDDDYRLSFLYGSYLTLTNLSEREWNRIEQMRLTPLYVSVHATEPALRRRLLKNDRAGQILDQLRWFQARQLQVHAQVVVCPGINDGPALQRTLEELAELHVGDIPAVLSVAVVPVGLTRFRPDQDELSPVTPDDAQRTLDLVQPLQEKFRDRFGSSFVWLADEWFLLAGRELPPASSYEDYPQLENGVGSIRSFIDQFQAAAARLPKALPEPRRLTWVVGNVVEKAFRPLEARLNAVEGLDVRLRGIASHYWGQSLTVTGLLTGEDLIRALKAPAASPTVSPAFSPVTSASVQSTRTRMVLASATTSTPSADQPSILHSSDSPLGDAILLPSVMLKRGDTRFLDDLRVEDVSRELQVPIRIAHGIEGLFEACLS